MAENNNGFLLIDKPRDISSFDVIRVLRRITGIKRIGHTGTLDPFATGLLICALGNYTRLCIYLEAQDKCYTATLKLGEQTETGDTEGKLTITGKLIPDTIAERELAEAVMSLSELPTPAFSAVKVQGRPAYDYARHGIVLELGMRPTRISSFQVLSYAAPYLTYSCEVSKGTYIRSLGEYIAQYLGTVGHTTKLCRTYIGVIHLKDSHALDAINRDNFRSLFYPAQSLFASYSGYEPDDSELSELRNGQVITQVGEEAPIVMLYGSDGNVLGVAKREAGKLHPVINLASGIVNA